MMDLFPTSKPMSPNTNQQMTIFLDSPFNRPIGSRFQIVNRDLVLFKISHPLEMLHQSLELVISSNDGFGIDRGDRQVGEQDGFLS